MKIENLRSEKKADRARVIATVIWEDCDRPPQEVFFETHETFAQDISCNPHAFLVACTMPAMHGGEERVFIDAEICPELRDGLVTAMGWIRHWFYRDGKRLPRIDTKVQRHLPASSNLPRAGFFFSGGIDSLATLRNNRLNYPHENPGSIKDGLIIGGLEVAERETFENVVNSLKNIAEDANITLIPVYTNIRDLNNDWKFWGNEWQGAALSAVAHAFTKRLSLIYIAASDEISTIYPFGSHPLIDPNYTSSALRVKHDGAALSRFAKTDLVANWEIALKNIRVCTFSEKYENNMLNCGECEKCVRTMLALLALGVLDKTSAFPKQNVSSELVMKGIKINTDVIAYYQELFVPLTNVGRSDLVRAIEGKIDEFFQLQRNAKWRKKTIEPIKEFDSRYLKGNLKRLKQMVFAQRSAR